MGEKLQALLWITTVGLLYVDLWLALRVVTGAVRRKRLADLALLAAGAAVVYAVVRGIPATALSMPLPLITGLGVGLAWYGIQGLFQKRSLCSWQEKKREREDSRQAILHLVLVTGSAVFLFPFLWLVSTSVKVEDKMFTQPPELLPRRYLIACIDGAVHKLTRIEADGKELIAAVYSSAGDKTEVRALLVTDRMREVPDKQVDYQGNVKIPVKGSMLPLAIVTIPDKKHGDLKFSAAVAGDAGSGLLRVYEITAHRKPLFLAAESVTLLQQIHFEWANYPKALEFLPEETGHGLVFLRNTLYLCLMNILGTVLSASLVAYSFARLRWPGRDALFVVLLGTMMLPGAVTMIPVFLIFRALGWIDTLRPLWVPAFFGSAFQIFLLRQFFMTIPTDLEDAAKIDGCSYFGIYWRIMLPLVKPALATLTIFAFMGAWNDFMRPLIYISSPEKMPLAYALQLFQSAHGSEYGLQMAASTLVVLPVLAVFFFTQRYFIQGITLTGMKQ